MRVREYNETRHLLEIRNCLVELQDFERSIDHRLPPGTEVVDEYVSHMLEQCEESHGQILVAEVDGDVAGFVTVLTRVKSEDINEGDAEHGLIADLMVKTRFRGSGLGNQLLDAAEDYARSSGVRWLRIGVMSENHAARRLYEARGFETTYVELEKDMRQSGPDSG